MPNTASIVGRTFAHNLLAGALAIVLAISSAREGRADYQYCGDLDSLEWLTDASTLIVVGTLEPAGKKTPADEFVCRIAALFKQMPQSTWKTGDVLPGVSLRGIKQEPGKKILLFLSERDRTLHEISSVGLPAEGEVKEGYLLPDMRGNALRKNEVVLKMIAARVEQGRRQTYDHAPLVSNASFVDESISTELDCSDGFYYVRVPPDECFRDSLEKGTTCPGLNGRSILYRLYSGRNEAQRATDRREDVRQTLQLARKQFAKGNWQLRYGSALTYPAYRYAKTSTDGKYAVLLLDGQLELYATADDSLLYRDSNCYHHYDQLSGLIFSPDTKYFAHLHANGDVTVVDLAARKRLSLCKLGWPVADNTYLTQFTFSPNGRYVALNLSHGEAGKGSAILAWRCDTGECVYTKSKQWELHKDFHLVGFDPYSQEIKVAEMSFWNLAEQRPESHVETGWRLPNKEDQPHATVMRFPGEPSLAAFDNMAIPGSPRAVPAANTATQTSAGTQNNASPEKQFRSGRRHRWPRR